MSAAVQAELFEPGEYLSSGHGYFSLLWKGPGAESKAVQKAYDLIRLPEIMRLINPRIDTWISQAIFEQANRRAVNVRDVGLLFADLDTYKAENLKTFSPEKQAEKLCGFCRDEGLPAPSIVLFSGRGLQAKWLLTEAQPRLNLMAWKDTQNALVTLLEPFAADHNAKDVSRVLRLDRTINTKSGEICRVVYVTGTESCIARYDFKELSSLLVERGDSVEKTAKTKGKKFSAGKVIYADFSEADKARHSVATSRRLQQLNWTRLEDIRRLWKARGGVKEGHRETTLFWMLNQLLMAQPVRIEAMRYEAEALAREISHNDFFQHSDLSTLYRKAKEYRDGGRVEFDGKLLTPFYTPRNETLINIFEIKPHEEMQLSTIISEAERQRRQTEKRRAAGVKPRAEYESQSKSRLKPWESEGISRATWYRQQGVRQVCALSCVGGLRGMVNSEKTVRRQ